MTVRPRSRKIGFTAGVLPIYPLLLNLLRSAENQPVTREALLF